jgi:hypothetical protein
MNSSRSKEDEFREKLQPCNSFQFSNSASSSRLRHSARQDVTPSPEVDTDITILNETPKEKADRLLQEANKRDIALMAASSRATTRYAALYAASKNRGLEASLGKSLVNLEAIKIKKLKTIQQSQETVKDDFKKTKKVALRREKQLGRYKSESNIHENRRSYAGHCRHNRSIRLPPIRLRSSYST